MPTRSGPTVQLCERHAAEMQALGAALSNVSLEGADTAREGGG